MLHVLNFLFIFIPLWMINNGYAKFEYTLDRQFCHFPKLSLVLSNHVLVIDLHVGPTVEFIVQR